MFNSRLALFFLTFAAWGLAGPAAANEDSLRDSVARMAKSTSSWSPSFSPDGKSIAYVSDLSGVPQVWMVPSAGGFPVQITDMSATVNSVSWSPDGKNLAVTAAAGGGMNQQIYLVSPDGLSNDRITAGGRETNFLGEWKKDGSALSYSSNIKSAGSMPPYFYALKNKTAQAVAADRGLSRVNDIHPTGQSILLSRLAGRGSNDLYLVDLATKQEVHLTPHEGPGTFFGQFGATGERVYLAHNQGLDKIAFGFIQLSDKQPRIQTLVSRDDAELANFQITLDGGVAALLWNNHGRSELELFDFAHNTRKSVSLPTDLVGELEFSSDGQLLAMAGRGASAPRDIYVLQMADSSIRKVTRSSHPGVDLGSLVSPELVKFKSHDGLELSGWLYRPVGAEKQAPYVLSFHGGPEGQERPAFRSVYQALLSNGVGVFAPNIRGSSGFGKRFVNLDNQELRVDANKDIAACAEYLVSANIADPKRIGIMGGSYGGYAVMVGVTDFPDLFAAGVNLFGMVNFETFFANTEPWMAAISGTEYGDPNSQRDLLKALSPIHKLDRVTTPLLVLHGANDTNVPVVEAEQVVDSLQERGVPVKYILFEDEGHGFRKAVNRVTSDVETVEWFSKYLNGS